MHHISLQRWYHNNEVYATWEKIGVTRHLMYSAKKKKKKKN